MVDANVLRMLIESGQITVEPEALKLKVGTLEVDFSADCRGTVTVDGKQLAVRGLEIFCRVGQVAKVILDLVPILIKKG